MILYHGSTLEVSAPKNEDHTLIRATLVPAIVAFLAVHYHVSEGDAMEMFYRSKTAEAFADDSLGLYGQSALSIAADVIQEREGR